MAEARSRRRRSMAERARVLRAWAASELPVAEFGAKHGVSVDSLYRWRREERQRRPTRRRAKPPPAVVPVRVVGAASPAPLEIVLRNGRRVRCHGDVDPAMLARVVTVLETVACWRPRRRCRSTSRPGRTECGARMPNWRRRGRRRQRAPIRSRETRAWRRA